jgi:hypothetical protein
MKDNIEVPLNTQELDALISALNYIDFEFGIEETRDEELREKLISFREKRNNDEINP